MTTEVVKNLSDNELRVKAAESCGWTNVGQKGFGSLELFGVHPELPSWPFSMLPHYCTDPGAMDEAEKRMSDRKRCEYERRLDAVGRISGEGDPVDTRRHAEAFVLTMSA